MNDFSLSIRQYSAEIGADGTKSIINALDHANWRRLRIFLALTVLYELLLILLVDLSSYAVAKAGTSIPGPGAPIGTGEEPWVSLLYMLCHGSLAFISVISLILAPLGLRSQRPGNGQNKSISVLIPMSILLFLGLIGALDQLRGLDIGAFTVNMTVVAILIFIKPPFQLIVFAPGFLATVGGIVFLQSDAALKTSYLANGGIFFTAVLILSAYLFNNQFSQLAKSLLLKRANERLDFLALHDQLTGLPNRRAFMPIFDREIERQKRAESSSFLAVADIDLFKNLNDAYGHPAGDAVLVHIARILTESLRKIDLAARWGGEEFVIYLDCRDTQSATDVLERARTAIENSTCAFDGKALKTTVSFGLTNINAYENDPFAGAYDRADKALYMAKEAGRNAIRFEKGILLH